MRKIILFSILLFIPFTFATSETYVLDLEKSIEIAKEKSYNMLNLVQDFKIAENNLKSATSNLKTHISLNFIAPDYKKSVEDFSTDTSITYYSSQRLNYGGNVVINQPLPTDGNIYIKSGISNTDYYSISKRTPSLYTTLGFEQPLTALYGYNEVKSDLKIAKLNYESSKKGLKREELNIVYLVSNSFYSLLSSQKKTEIARLDLERQTEANDISQNKYKSGLIKEVDALQMEVDLAEAQNNYELSLINQSSDLNEFKQLIGINLNDSVSLSTEFNYDIVIVDPEKAVQLALENRLEIREQEIAIEQSKMNVKKQKSVGMVQSSLNLSLGKYGTSTQSINTTLQSSIDNSYTDFINRDPDYSIGFTVSVPILDFGENRAKVQSAEARLEKNVLEKDQIQRNIEREVRNLVADLNSSLKRLQLLEKSVVIAEKSFDITRQRYADGDIDSQSLALERNRLNTAYTSHLSAYIKYQLLLADIMRKTFYDFRKNELLK
ncbi:MAG: TolC family protein [Paludibacter sp.]|nr:TolC family protein [Paludibacter sp.]